MCDEREVKKGDAALLHEMSLRLADTDSVFPVHWKSGSLKYTDFKLMAEGGTAKLTIPADIAYGDAGSGDKIPGGATICFEVELIKVLSGGVGGLVL